jgi:glutamine synthetase
MSAIRNSTIQSSVSRPARSVEWPTKEGRPAHVSEIFGENVFSFQMMQKTLPKPVYKSFIEQIKVLFIPPSV